MKSIVTEGQIVKNLIPTEPVAISKIQNLGSMMAITFTGINSNKVSNKVITLSEFQNLEILTEQGNFNFTGDPNRFCLYAEAERINSAYQFDPLFAVNCSIVDPLPHQVEAVYKFLLPLPKIRFLLADDTGAGKTIMTGLLIKELLMREIIDRVLIITPGGLTKQWQQDEMGVKFNLPFTLVNRSLFSSDPNIFHSAKRIVTSIDFISREDVMNVASNSHWDLIIIDEAHKLSAYDYGAKTYKAKRYLAAEKLSQQCEHLLLLTATPHRGRKDTFKKLMQLLDEDIFATDDLASARVRELEHSGVNKFFIRRLKEDMKDWNNNPLYKNRYTKTTAYELTPEEKTLYDEVTLYLTKRKEEASETKNIHVSLALTVMQRRLTSSIRAITNTLEKRHMALQGILEEIRKNPSLWNQRHRLEGFDIEDPEDYDELDDEEKESLENILSDPRKFKLFTTAKGPKELEAEANEVRKLYEMARTLSMRNQEEQKFKELSRLLESHGVINGEKLVIFTEHKDTLLYLEERLKNTGYKVSTIHGGKSVDERREAQGYFFKEAEILIATDAAGEGINLQFCRLLINWDIPWNPNRLEQRMGRVHRYGQKQDVLVFNLVASNTREGQVLERLLRKLDVIREGLGDDRVYDVIQDVLEGVSLDEVFNSVFNGKETALNDFLRQDDANLKITFQEKIKEQRERLAHSGVDYKDARRLKEDSDERRLQPIYIRLFFERAFNFLQGAFTELRPAIYRIDRLPDALAKTLREDFNIYADSLRQIQFCFDKYVFLDYQNVKDIGHVYYINPGNQIFDSLVKVIMHTCKEDMLKGTVLISPDDAEEFIAFFVKSQITDNRPSKRDGNIADERLMLIFQTKDGHYHHTSPAKFLDLRPPIEFAKPIEPPNVLSENDVMIWTFNNITLPQFQETQTHVADDTAKRREYLETAFTHIVLDLQSEIQELQGKLLYGDNRVQDKILKKEERIKELMLKKTERLQRLDLMNQLAPKQPEILGCAYVVPLSQVEYANHFGMSRDDEAEAAAMARSMEYELSQGWNPKDVSANNEGYDIKSVSPEQMKRYIEVKGRSGSDGSVIITENEMNRLAQLGETAWLYIVINCKTDPELYRIQNPAAQLKFQAKSKGIQYFLPMDEWRNKAL